MKLPQALAGLTLALVLGQAAAAPGLQERIATLVGNTRVIPLKLSEEAARRHVADGLADTIEVILVSEPAQGQSQVSEDGEVVLQYAESGLPTETLVQRAFVLRALRQLEDEAEAAGGLAGFGPWTFGMDRDAVRAQAMFAPYYPFPNGDLGSSSWPLGTLPGNETRPLSFTFTQDRLSRVMLLVYLGTETAQIEQAWSAAHAQLRQRFGGVVLAGDRLVDAETALQALRASGLLEGRVAQFQMAAHPRPRRRDVWVSARRAADGRTMVTLTHAAPR